MRALYNKFQQRMTHIQSLSSVDTLSTVACAPTSCSDKRERIKCLYEKWWVSNEALVSHCERLSVAFG